MKRWHSLLLIATLASASDCPKSQGTAASLDGARERSPGTKARQPRQSAAAVVPLPKGISQAATAPSQPGREPRAGSRGIVYCRRSLALATAHLVQVDLNRSDIRVTVGVARGGVGRSESWNRIIRRLRPTAAITGTYYDTATFVPVGTIVADGVAVHRGSVGTALTFRKGNRACFTRSRLASSAREVRTALHAGPRLVDRGRVSLMPAVEGFRDPGIFVRKPRAAVGLTRQNKLLLVTVTKPLYLHEMARLMQSLGAHDAMCMDGGSSTGLYCAGKSYQVPRRVMTNVLMVYAGAGIVPQPQKLPAAQAALISSNT